MRYYYNHDMLLEDIDDLNDEISCLESEIESLKLEMSTPKEPSWSVDITNDGTHIIKADGFECPQYIIQQIRKSK